MQESNATHWMTRLRMNEIASLSIVCGSISLLFALVALPVQWKSSTFPFGDNDFDLIGLGLMLANIVCLTLCWLPAAASLLSGVVALFSNGSRRMGLGGIIISILSVAIYMLAPSLFA